MVLFDGLLDNTQEKYLIQATAGLFLLRKHSLLWESNKKAEPLKQIGVDRP